MEALIRELTAAQRDATKPARFERAVGDAFAFLGFEVQLLGQASHTDVLIDSRLGYDRFRAVVDAKANGSGKVPEGQINWPAIQGHQRQATADYAAVVGERFGGGYMHKYATDFGIALVDTATLIELLRLHARTPFPASDLHPLLATAGPVAAVVADLRQKAEATDRHWRLIVDVITLVHDFSRLDVPLTPTTGNLHAALVARALASGGDRFMPPADQDVRDAVTFLASRAVGILRLVDPDTAGYRLTMSAPTARQRLKALEATIWGGLEPVPTGQVMGKTIEHTP